MRFRAVLFDAGETLVHPAPSFPELFAGVVTREGHARSEADVRLASHVIMDRFSEAARANERWTTSPERSRRFWTGVYDLMLEALELPSADGLPETLYAAFTDPDNYALFADVPGALTVLRDGGAVLGVVSNFEAWLDELLGSLGVRDEFPVRVISGIEGIEKPDPRIYQLALERIGVAASETAFVGDSPEFDVDPPAALGMFPVLIDRRGRHPEHTGTRITDLADLAKVLA